MDGGGRGGVEEQSVRVDAPAHRGHGELERRQELGNVGDLELDRDMRHIDRGGETRPARQWDLDAARRERQRGAGVVADSLMTWPGVTAAGPHDRDRPATE